MAGGGCPKYFEGCECEVCDRADHLNPFIECEKRCCEDDDVYSNTTGDTEVIWTEPPPD